MSLGQKISRAILQWPVSGLVNHKSLPENPITELNLDPARPIVYALKTSSITDLMTLQQCCEDLGLPGPFTPLELNGQLLPRYVCLDRPPPLFGKRSKPLPFLQEFHQLLDLHKQDPELDIQVVPVTLFWGRAPGREGEEASGLNIISSLAPNRLKKALIVILKGRENLVRFSPPLSLRYMADKHGTDEAIAHKLARVARTHFSRQQLAATGPKLPNRNLLFKQLLDSAVIQQAIEEEAQREGISLEKAQKRAHGYMDEIASNFSYRLIRLGESFLGWLWNKLYRGLSVNGAEKVRQLAQEGHEIVYVPCHRSHMDYLLLSYVIYHQGMVPPHIAAGINLNFWPAGPIFRHGGAFFIRRTFKGNPLYSTVFREYLNLLFAKGYSVEFFTEGGRSRTGRLLPPKTGMLAMTLQAMMRGLDRPVTLVPVYLGYEHVMEVNTYHNELKGSRKEKESFLQVLGILRKLRNYGRGFVNFGEPLTLNSYLSEHIPDWKKHIGEEERPEWMAGTVNNLAELLMTRINGAAAVNGLTLSALALLAAERHALTRDELQAQLNTYLDLLKAVPYSPQSTMPAEDAATLLDQAMELNKFEVSEDKLGQIISLDRYQAILLTYYRNNILHLFAMPSLVAALIERCEGISRSEIMARCIDIYPLLKTELFLRHEEEELPALVDSLLDALQTQQLIETRDDGYWVNPANQMRLLLLAESIQETLQRYAIVLTRVLAQPHIEAEQLEADGLMMAERLGTLHGINAPEFFDQKLFSTLIHTLRKEGYLSSECKPDLGRFQALADNIVPLLSNKIRRTIQAGNQL
ncbi:glycerol-3-phosphate 1-O-acyltransferase PlsB [Aeromonas veronii]|uniref:glycerol-3-phosphate 1-O-acyltransferase PlsB n=1 Tax=Aeromonas TaxID=642 RepID=UPI00224ECD2B|nr:glycerol-3-phosphate 1-O-acyltransferase PlsB [Aeromonas veronii]MCX4047042.1 glycerol-3-phosphate 1-O-acyltransferase PlsB [Aeromonas veronii]HDN9008070.1 glycerol-3-phosphate 1-O-acyltransferase PlsB [Aeromonas veronii]